MTESSNDVDRQLKVELIDESLEALSGLTPLFKKLQMQPEDSGPMESIFRVIHSIKGNAPFFELMQIKNLAHSMENVLDAIRKRQLAVQDDIVGSLLEGTDELTRMLERAREDEPEVHDEDAFARLLDLFQGFLGREEATRESRWNELLECVESFSAGAELYEDDSLQQVAKQAKGLAQELARGEGIHLQEPALHTSQSGESSARGSQELPDEAKRVQQMLTSEEAFSSLEPEQLEQALQELASRVRNEEAVSVLKELQEDFRASVEKIGFIPLVQDILMGHFEHLLEVAQWAPGEEEESPPEDTTEQQPTSASEGEKQPGGSGEPPAAAATARQQKSETTMRVREESIDAFLSFVGELIVIGEMYDHLKERVQEVDTRQTVTGELHRVNEAFHELSGKLQQNIMHIRRVPVKPLLQRAPRIAREIAGHTEKEIAVDVSGENTLVDKSILGVLETPLTHMVRNAVDHGIEPPDVREREGKARSGQITVSVEERDKMIVMEVRDDGGGINMEALHQKAIDAGMISPEMRLSENEIVDLLFASGISTAEQVTDVSGRGVGMDAVKHELEKRGGKISVETELKAGTCFRVTIPAEVTTQILTGFSVIANGQRLIIPTDYIVHCFRPEADQIFTVQGKTECVKTGDSILTVRRCATVCSLGNGSCTTGSLQEGTLIVLESKGRRFALHVDAIEGVKQFVLKDIEQISGEQSLFIGGAVMGNGTVALVVNINAIAETMERQPAHAENNATAPLINV
ncbi:MAG: chemotaxis protein CheA [Synergistales bacterium]|nr:chemotaxis protein CheA [Synergistales bacterium]